MVDDINAKIELDGAQFLRTLNKIISGLADLPRESAAATAAIDKLEKQAVGLAAAFSKSTGAIVGQKAAVESLISSYNKLGLASLKGAGAVAKELQSAFKLAGGTTLADQFGLRPLSQDMKNTVGTIKTMNSLYEQQNRIRLEGARAVNGADMPDKAGFLAAQKRNQQAAYQSYQSNIAYSKSISEVNNGLANQRYALYDVASTFAVVSVATLGAALMAAKFAVDYQKNFANVARTTGATGEELSNLRAQLIDLSTVLPTSFEDITNIATLGAQLGVATEGIDEFTEVVAKLTATTNLTSEAAGTALGRFDALFEEIDPSQFEALGSAILKVGVNTVATESQIVNTSVQISSMGDFAGLTAEQVVGLSGALASVGAQPELARGTITRVFTLMSGAVSAGGDALNEFARISGVSADQFKSTWGTPEFANVFQGFLRGIEGEGQGAIQTLNDLGVSSVRDVPLLLRLAGAGDVVKKSFDSAATGFADGTELNKQYAITAETVAAKLTMLGNTLKAIIEAPGSAALGPIAGIIDTIQNLAKVLLDLAGTDVGKVLGVVVISITALVGVMTGLRAMQALVTASSYAMITAQAGMEKQGLSSSSALGSLTKQMLALTVGTTRATAATTAFTAAQAAGAGRVTALAAGARAGVGAVNGLAAAGRSAMLAFGWLGALSVGISLLTQFAASNAEAKSNIEALTATLDTQTGALTENTAAWIAKKLEDQGTLERLREMGVSTQLAVAAVQGETAAVREVTAQLAAYRDAQVAATEGGREGADAMINAKNSTLAVSRELGILTNQVSESRDSWERVNEATGGAADAMDEASVAGADLVGELQKILDTQYEIVGGTVAVQNALYALGSSLGENGTDFSEYSVAGRANLAALQSSLSAMVVASGGDANALATMIAGLMQSLAAMGVDTVNQLAFVQNALAQLTGGKGVGSLPGVGQAAAQAGNALGQGFSVGANKAAKSANRAAKGAGGAAKEIKTLTDYVSDLSSVFKNAFDIRFGMEKSVDGVADAYAKLSDYAADAAESVTDAVNAIRQADADIQGLNAANTTLNYQLVVAQEYGDTLRANEILAEIAKNNAEIAEKQDDRAKSGKDLTKANNALNKSLDGSTVESREQRDMVLALTESYQAQILALANSGLSQAEVARRTQELKNQFVAQLTQMGYNRAEVDRYALAFDDLTAAILRVPRNITVNADTSPAQRAIDEFLARNANRTTNVGTNLSVPDGGSTYGLGASAGAAYADGWNAQMQAKRRLMVQVDGSVPGGKRYSTDGGQTWFLQKGGRVGKGRQPEYHSRGGVHGLGFKPRGTDTTPAMLTPGEHVTQKPAVDYYGLPFFNAINNMQFPKYLATGSSGSSGRSSGSGAPHVQLVELLPHQVAQLAEAMTAELRLDGTIVAEASNKANAGFARRGTN